MLNFFKHRRRKRLFEQPLPQEWREIIHKNVPYYRTLPTELRKRLHGLVQIFLAEKTFEGCGGLELTGEIKVTVAAQACILVLGSDDLNLFPSLTSILIYPTAYFAPVKHHEEGGVVIEGEEYRLGEAWSRGHVVLAWDKVQKGASDIHDGQNLVFHEFAHQLDYDYGATETIYEENTHSQFIAWARVLTGEYEKLVRDIRKRNPTLIDEYGAVNIAEFFAVATETFFEKPSLLRKKHPNLYEQLSNFYRQDPASYEKKEVR